MPDDTAFGSTAIGWQAVALFRIMQALTEQKYPCANARPSRRIGNLTSHEPTIFWILKSCKIANTQAAKGNATNTEGT